MLSLSRLSITKYISSDVIKFVYIRYFWDLPRLCFTSIKGIKRSIKTCVKNTRSIKSIKVSKILGKIYVDKISYYSRLLFIFNEISFILLLRFSSISITRL